MNKAAKTGFKRNLDAVIVFRMSPDDRTRLEAKARADDRDISSTVRHIVRQHLGDEKKAG